MAVRFSADAQDYTNALALGSQGALTVSCWFKVSTDRNTYSTPWSIDNSTANNWVLQSAVDGTTMGVVADGNTLQNMGSVTVGTWYYACLAVNGSTGTLYYKAAGAGALSTVAISGGTTTVNAATLRIGESPWGTEWLNGCVAGLKFWTAQLTAAEVDNECRQYQPLRLANLQTFYPLVKPETADYSGNAHTLTGGSGTATEDGPPIPWHIITPRLIRSAAATGHTTNLGQVSETDTATATIRAKSRAVGQPAEADTATAVTRAKRVTVGQAVESSTVFAVSRSKVRSVNQAVETDVLLSVSSGHRRNLGQPSEAGTATTVSRSKARAIGQPVESDTATTVVRSKRRAVGQSTELDTAVSVGRAKTRVTGQSSEIDSSTALVRVKRRAVAQSSEADAATSVTRSGQGVVTIGQAAEVDTATLVVRVKRLSVVEPAETSTAQTLARSKRRSVSTASATSTATAASRVKSRAVAQTVEGDAAQPVTVQGANHPIVIGQAITVHTATSVVRVKRANLAAVQVIATAQSVVRRKQLVLAGAVETDTAQEMSRSHRDLVVYVRAADSKWQITSIQHSRWSVKPQPSRWTAT